MSESAPAALTAEEVKVWRKAQRPVMIARREAAPPHERKAWNDRITGHLVAGFEMPAAAGAVCAGIIAAVCAPEAWNGRRKCGLLHAGAEPAGSGMSECVTASRGGGPVRNRAQSGSAWRIAVAERGSGSKRNSISAGALHSVRFFKQVAGNR